MHKPADDIVDAEFEVVEDLKALPAPEEPDGFARSEELNLIEKPEEIEVEFWVMIKTDGQPVRESLETDASDIFARIHIKQKVRKGAGGVMQNG